MAKNRSKEESQQVGSECLNSKTCHLIQLCPEAPGSHKEDSDDEESNSYHLLSTYYGSGT